MNLLELVQFTAAEMELKGTESLQQNSVANKETAKSKTKCEPVNSKQDSDLQGTPELLNPSVLDEVLAEKKMALMRSPEVMKFLQSQQAKLVKQNKESEDED